MELAREVARVGSIEPVDGYLWRDRGRDDGAITKRLQDRYFDVVKGKDESHPEWLTFV